MSEKPLLMVLGPIWAKVEFWKKKVAKFAQKYWKSQIFWISQSHKMADNYSKTPQSLSKILFMSQTQKFMKIFQKTYPPPPKKKGLFLGGGGVNLLNVVFAIFDSMNILFLNWQRIVSFNYFQSSKVKLLFFKFETKPDFSSTWKIFFMPQTKKTIKKRFLFFFSKPYFSRPKILFAKKKFWSWKKNNLFFISFSVWA